jgi:hypothetical protein
MDHIPIDKPDDSKKRKFDDKNNNNNNNTTSSSSKGEVDISAFEAELKAKPRVEFQALAREKGVKANAKSAKIIKDLVKAKEKELGSRCAYILFVIEIS